MRTGRLFWGVLLVQAGLMVLLYRFGILPYSWYLSTTWWPLVLILMGSTMMVRGSLKVVFTVLTALAVGFLIAGLFRSGWCRYVDVFEVDHSEAHVQFLTEAFDSTVTHAAARVDMFAGELILIEPADNLVDVTARTKAGGFRLRSERGEHEATVTIDQKRGPRFSGRKGLNELTLRLHPDPIWDLRFDVGAAELTADLSRFRVESVSIDAGAAEIDVIMGENVASARVRIDAGAADIRLHVPQSAGCEVIVDAGLASRNLSGFESAGGHRYRTRNYDTAPHVISISIDSGASSINVERY